MDIWFAKDKNVLSNLSYRPFMFMDRKYITVEHAYQSNKSGSFDEATYSKNWKAGSKFIGKRVNKEVSIRLMDYLIRDSMNQNPEVLIYLANTGSEILTHVKDRGIWKTVFPKILMKIREELNVKRHNN